MALFDWELSILDVTLNLRNKTNLKINTLFTQNWKIEKKGYIQSPSQKQKRGSIPQDPHPHLFRFLFLFLFFTWDRILLMKFLWSNLLQTDLKYRFHLIQWIFTGPLKKKGFLLVLTQIPSCWRLKLNPYQFAQFGLLLSIKYYGILASELHQESLNSHHNKWQPQSPMLRVLSFHSYLELLSLTFYLYC